MIKIKQLINPNKDLYNVFFEYCVKSKPYDFCELNSIKLRNFKINEYYDSLLSICEIFECKEDDKTVWYVFLSKQKDNLIVEFAIGDNKNFKSKILIQVLHEVFIVAQTMFNKKYIKTSIQRRYKKQNLINWLKRYDKVAEFIEINGKTDIIWKYERLN
jgi:hypothetical protein